MTDEQIYRWLDGVVEKDKLFLNPSLRRADLMEIVGTNKNRFGHIVRAFSGCPNVTVYINNKRLAYAKGLMQSCPQKPNKVIAIECGIVNIITFTRLFHKYYGMTPSDYRNILAMQS